MPTPFGRSRQLRVAPAHPSAVLALYRLHRALRPRTSIVSGKQTSRTNHGPRAGSVSRPYRSFRRKPSEFCAGVRGGSANAPSRGRPAPVCERSEEHTSELPSLILISYSFFFFTNQNQHINHY